MSTVLERSSMARPKGRPSTGRDEVTVKLDRIVAGKAKAVATHRGITVGELLTEITKAPVDRAYAQMLRELESKA